MQLLLLSFLLAIASAIPLTLKVPANDRQCLYTDVDQVESKVGFYFAVQAGGAFDIDVAILSPSGRVLYNEPKEKQGEFSFAASEVGEYQFCFSNDMSTFAEKSIEFAGSCLIITSRPSCQSILARRKLTRLSRLLC